MYVFMIFIDKTDLKNVIGNTLGMNAEVLCQKIWRLLSVRALIILRAY